MEGEIRQLSKDNRNNKKISLINNPAQDEC